MAFRLDQAIVRGELDNTERGHVRGTIWLEGRAQPLTIDLEGDAWRDVAGARITFINPEPRRQKNQGELKPAQHGIVGDITASRKVRLITATDEEWQQCMDEEAPVPCEWRNSLYIEWFSEENGRVVIEATDFEMHITAFTWQMDEAEEQAQQFANLNAMRNWLATIIQRPDEDEDGEDDEEAPITEAEWEESLKRSDRLSDAHMEAMDKYGDDDEDETKVAFVMGWDHMLDMMADAHENSGKKVSTGELGDDDDDDEGDEWKDDDSEEDEAIAAYMQERINHPLKVRARKLVSRILRDLRHDDRKEREWLDEEEARGTPLNRFISNAMNISGKLAGALATRRFAEGQDAGYTLAILKRCLNWSNDALSGLNDLMSDVLWEDRHPLFSEYKRELHAIRDGITDLRQEIRQANPEL